MLMKLKRCLASQDAQEVKLMMMMMMMKVDNEDKILHLH